MGPPKCGAPGNCPICPPLKPALSGIPPLKGHIKHVHLITCSSIDDIE